MGVAYLHHIYLHEGLFFIWSMHKYTSPMDPMGKSTPCFDFSSTFWNRFCPLTKVTKLSDSSFPTLPHIHCSEVLFCVFHCFCRCFLWFYTLQGIKDIFSSSENFRTVKKFGFQIFCADTASQLDWVVVSFFMFTPEFGEDSQFD